MAITQTPTPTLACTVGVTAKGRNGEAIVVLVTVVGSGVETNLN